MILLLLGAGALGKMPFLLRLLLWSLLRWGRRRRRLWILWYSTRRTVVRRPEVLSQLSKGRCHEDKSFPHVPHLISSDPIAASWRRWWWWRNRHCYLWRGRRQRRIQVHRRTGQVRCLTLVCIQVHCLESFVGLFGLLRSFLEEVLFVQRWRRRRRHEEVSAMLLLSWAFTLGKLCLLLLVIAVDREELRVHAHRFAPDRRHFLVMGA